MTGILNIENGQITGLTQEDYEKCPNCPARLGKACRGIYTSFANSSIVNGQVGTLATEEDFENAECLK